MKYFFEKVVEVPGEPITFEKPHPWNKREKVYEYNPESEEMLIKNPLGIELPEMLPRTTRFMNSWHLWREAGWFSSPHEAVPGLVTDERGNLCGRDAEGYSVWWKPETDEELFDALMRDYDWYYEMSDDFRYWHAGEALDRRLRTLVKESKTLTPARAVEIWNKYAPKDDTERGVPGRQVQELWFTR